MNPFRSVQGVPSELVVGEFHVAKKEGPVTAQVKFVTGPGATESLDVVKPYGIDQSETCEGSVWLLTLTLA